MYPSLFWGRRPHHLHGEGVASNAWEQFGIIVYLGDESDVTVRENQEMPDPLKRVEASHDGELHACHAKDEAVCPILGPAERHLPFNGLFWAILLFDGAADIL